MVVLDVNNYVVLGCINQRRMERVALTFKQYLADLGKKFLLTRDATIIGMESYGYNSRSFLNKYSHPGEDYQDHPDDNRLRLDHIDDQLNEAGFKFPSNLMNPPTGGKITLHGHEIDLANFSEGARKSIIKDWQRENVFDYIENTPPLGFIFSVNEPHYKENLQKEGAWAHGLQVHCNLNHIRPRAMIVTSKNMDLWLDWEFTDGGDLVVCNWNTGTKFGIIKVISYYGENNTNLPRAEQKSPDYVIVKKLRRLLTKCTRESIHFLILGDINS